MPFVKAFGVKDASSLAAIGDYPTDLVLLDAYCPGQYGGSGETFDWALDARIDKHTDARDFDLGKPRARVFQRDVALRLRPKIDP